MLVVVGTVPDQKFPLATGEVRVEGDCIRIGDISAPINRGTPALLAAACTSAEGLGLPAPFGYLVGDIGLGDGSRRLYEYLSVHLGKREFSTIVFHYLQPDVDWHNRVFFTLEDMEKRPVIIADAGFMYAAKMSGQSPEYDLFTPDAGELAFLADEKAPHPFYTRGFVLHEETRVPDLITRAYKHNNAARYLLVKGQPDFVADQEGIWATVDSPVEEALEAIGGTGDTLTGIVTALIDAGMGVREAAVLAARANRLAGHYAAPSPATQVIEIIQHIPRAMKRVLNGNHKNP